MKLLLMASDVVSQKNLVIGKLERFHAVVTLLVDMVIFYSFN